MENRKYILHVVFSRKDDMYNHIHHDEVVEDVSDAYEAYIEVCKRLAKKKLKDLDSTFDYAAHNHTIGVPIELR